MVVGVGVEREPADGSDLEVAVGPVGLPDAGVLDGEFEGDADLGPVGLDDGHVLLVLALADLGVEGEVGDAGLGEELLGLLGVIVELGGVVVARGGRSQPAASGLAGAGQGVVDEGLTVDGQGEGLCGP